MSWLKVKATNGGGMSEPAPAGSHAANLVALVDLGIQEEEFQGAFKNVHQVYLVWELADEEDSAGQRFLLGRVFTLSFAQRANLRIWIEKLQGRPMADSEDFDLSSLLGKPCMLSVSRSASAKGKEYAKADGMAAVPKKLQVAEPSRKPVTVGQDELINSAVPDWLPYIYGENVREVMSRGFPAVPRATKGESNGRTVHSGPTANEDTIPF